MRRKNSSPQRKRKRISDQLQGGETILISIITVVFFILSTFTLFYHNKNATNGYKIKTLRENREEIMFAIEILDRQIADVSAINAYKSTDNAEEEIETTQSYKTKMIYLTSENKNKDTEDKDNRVEVE